MEELKLFYRKTYYFWIVTRIAIIIFFSFVLINRPAADDIPIFAAQALIAIYILSMIICSIYDFVKRKISKWIKYVIGFLAILIGLILIYISANPRFSLLTFGIAIWIIFYGIWEIVTKNE